MREVIKAFSVTQKPIPFGIQATGTSYCDKTYYASTDCAAFYTLEYIISGYGTAVNNGTTYTVGPGDIIAFPAGYAHSLKSDDKDPWLKVWINFYGTTVPTLYDSYQLGDHIVFHPQNNRIHDLVTRFMEISSSDMYEAELFNAVAVIIHQIYIELYTLISQKQSGIHLEMQELYQFLASNADTEISLNEVCRKFKMSRSYMFKHFKDAYGISPYEFYQKRRLNIAVQLLTYSSLSIKEISNNMHFADQHYFSNWFKNQLSVSPAEYRKTLRTEDTKNTLPLT